MALWPFWLLWPWRLERTLFYVSLTYHVARLIYIYIIIHPDCVIFYFIVIFSTVLGTKIKHKEYNIWLPKCIRHVDGPSWVCRNDRIHPNRVAMSVLLPSNIIPSRSTSSLAEKYTEYWSYPIYACFDTTPYHCSYMRCCTLWHRKIYSIFTQLTLW